MHGERMRFVALRPSLGARVCCDFSLWRSLQQLHLFGAFRITMSCVVGSCCVERLGTSTVPCAFLKLLSASFVLAHDNFRLESRRTVLSPQFEHTSEAASVLCTSLILVAPRRAARAATSVQPSPVRDGLRIAVYLGKGGNATIGQWNNWASERLNVLSLLDPRLMRVTALWMTFGFFSWSEYLTMTLAVLQIGLVVKVCEILM